MIDLRLERQSFTPRATEGRLTLDGAPLCATLEDHSPWNQPGAVKVAGETCIPPGRYPVILVDSVRFGADTLGVMDVPGFTHVRIHSGNRPADTEGCILVGLEATTPTDEWIGRSRDALAFVKTAVVWRLKAGEACVLTITEAR